MVQKRLPIPKNADLECAVNVPYGDNCLSTSSHFSNLSDTFRASVICGQTIDLLRREMLFGDSRPLTTNQKAGSSNLSGRATYLSLRSGLTERGLGLVIVLWGRGDKAE
jgi:hypothetical protein